MCALVHVATEQVVEISDGRPRVTNNPYAGNRGRDAGARVGMCIAARSPSTTLPLLDTTSVLQLVTLVAAVSLTRCSLCASPATATLCKMV